MAEYKHKLRFVRAPATRTRSHAPYDPENPSMTQQSHKDQTDVNAIVARFERSGQLPVELGTPVYADATLLQGDLTTQIAQANEDIEAATDYRDDLNALAAAKLAEPKTEPPESQESKEPPEPPPK